MYSYEERMRAVQLKNNGCHGVKKRHGGGPDAKEWISFHCQTAKSA